MFSAALKILIMNEITLFLLKEKVPLSQEGFCILYFSPPYFPEGMTMSQGGDKGQCH